MKVLKGLFITLIVIVLIVAIALVAVYFYVKGQFEIDLIQTVQELVILKEDVNEDALCPNAFSDADMVDVQSTVNASVDNFISYTEENGYVINLDDLPEEMTHLIRLSDKQVGALASVVVEQELEGKMQLAGNNVDVKLLQVDFCDVQEDSANLNIVVKVDISTILNTLDSFPGNLLKNMVPSTLYISSTVVISQGEDAFSFDIAHSSLTVNNLNDEQTADIFHTLDVLLKTGSHEELNLLIGNMIATALIGTPTQTGIVSSLREIGATGYHFDSDTEGDYFIVDYNPIA